MTFTYTSTRGLSPALNFEATVLAGLAPDGGLYVPDALPQFSAGQLREMAALDYPALAAAVLGEFFENSSPRLRGEVSRGELPPPTPLTPAFAGEAPLPSPASSLHSFGASADRSGRGELVTLLEDSYATFRHAAVAPLKQLGPDDWLLELFHGPTLAFKDFALQFLGRVLDELLADAGNATSPGKARREAAGVWGGKPPSQKITILGATSGDTGSAAIAGCRGREHMRIVILHPHERVSAIQRRQMTTVHDANVHNIAIQGSFDDCQNIVKALFTDAEFRAAQRLTAVNSINWARIIAQIVYYFYAGLRLGSAKRPVHFAVPTGNFGDIYAGYLAKKMGLPVGRLIIASNRNDILTRCVATGEYSMAAVTPSLSPSMDIQISSNFERLLFEFYGRDGAALREIMRQLKEEGGFRLSKAAQAQLQEHFAAVKADDAQTTATIRSTYETTGEIVDPHTAVGIFAAQKLRGELEGPVVTLATAHPAKFPDAVKAAIGVEPALPEHMRAIMDEAEKFTVLPADAEKVKAYIAGL